MADWRDTGKRLRNWGRWGAADQVGTLNHIEAAQIVAAAALVREGKTFSLAIPLDDAGPMDGFLRQNPRRSTTAVAQPVASATVPGFGARLNETPFRYTDDEVTMGLQSSTQWDALSHCSYDGQMYNGFGVEYVSAGGSERVGIEHPAHRGGVVGRGVLVDLARHEGVDYLAEGHVVRPADLRAAADRQRVAVRKGDVLLIRTGWRRRMVERGPEDWLRDAPGLSWTCAELLAEWQLAAVACDNATVEARNEPGSTALALHMIVLRDMGMMLGEIWDLEELADDCAADGRYEFMLVAAPLPFTHASGSPVNPVAIK